MEQKTASARKFTWKEKMAALGPGFLIVGSFIGPGTVTSSTRAGATYGFQLFWCVIFSGHRGYRGTGDVGKTRHHHPGGTCGELKK